MGNISAHPGLWRRSEAQVHHPHAGGCGKVSGVNLVCMTPGTFRSQHWMSSCGVLDLAGLLLGRLLLHTGILSCLAIPHKSALAMCRNVRVPGSGPENITPQKRSAAPELHQTRARAVRRAIAQSSTAQPTPVAPPVPITAAP